MEEPTMRDLFAMLAPPEPPEWFLGDEQDKAKRYFAWRWHYAETMDQLRRQRRKPRDKSNRG